MFGLQTLQDLLNCRIVSQRWFRISCNPQLWKRFYLLFFGTSNQNLEKVVISSWELLFQAHSRSIEFLTHRAKAIWAIEMGAINLLKTLVDRDPSCLLPISPSAQTLLNYRVPGLLGGSVEDLKDDPLLFAVHKQDFEIVRFICRSNKYPVSLCPHTSLCLAAATGSSRILRLLIKHKCSCPIAIELAISFGIRSQRVSILKLLQEQGADLKGEGRIAELGGFHTHLSYACSIGNLRIVNFLIHAGCDVNKHSPIPHGPTTPLSIACQHGHRHIVKILILSGAQIDFPNLDGSTALHIAVRGGFPRIYQTLVQMGANPLIPDRFGRTPKQLYALFFESALGRYHDMPTED